MTDIAARLASLDWSRIAGDLDRWGAATTGALLSAGECRVLRDGYGDGDGRYRSTVVMARHGYGSGEYRYFAYPLPATVAALREGLYPPLAGLANRWGERRTEERRFPPRLDDWLAECHPAGQVRPTPLLLKYGPGAYDFLHRLNT